jgi:GDP-4-dehydro-6-deoxy-D-mannose reductase
MRALVTGASGFVGRHLVCELDEAGYDILATDIVGASACGVAEGNAFPACTAFEVLDLTRADDVRKAVECFRPGAVFHLAAQSSAARSFEQPRQTLETNILGTLNLLEAVRSSMKNSGEAIRVLSVGSCEEYGRRSPAEMPLTEKSPVEPVSPYAVSKAAQSMLALQYHAAFGIECVVTRSFSHTGIGQPDRFVLPAFARQCAMVKAGCCEGLIRVGNLDVTRDFLDVRDVIRAYRLLVEKGRAGTVYNVCRGEGLGLADALQTLIDLTGCEVKVETDPALLRAADVPVLIGDNGRLRSDTGWIPSISTKRMLTDLFVYWEQRVADSA